MAGSIELAPRFGKNWLNDHYELTLAPQEDDPTYGLKMDLLAGSNAGLTQHLGQNVKIVGLLASSVADLASNQSPIF